MKITILALERYGEVDLWAFSGEGDSGKEQAERMLAEICRQDFDEVVKNPQYPLSSMGSDRITIDVYFEEAWPDKHYIVKTIGEEVKSPAPLIQPCPDHPKVRMGLASSRAEFGGHMTLVDYATGRWMQLSLYMSGRTALFLDDPRINDEKYPGHFYCAVCGNKLRIGVEHGN